MSEYLSALSHSGIPENTIWLIEGVAVMLCTCGNLSIDGRLTDGTKAVVLDIKPHILQVETLDEGRTDHWLPRMVFTSISKQGVAGKRVQFPIMLPVEVTIHRSQGQTLDWTCSDLTLDPSTHGHLYVGMSRVRRSGDVVVLTTADRIDSHGYANVHQRYFQVVASGM